MKKKILKEKILYPKYLYQYRTVNNNLEVLRTNKLFLSHAGNFDDPFDTFLHVNVDKLKYKYELNYKSLATIDKLSRKIEKLFSETKNEILKERLKKITSPDMLPNLYQNGLTNLVLANALNLRTKIQDRIYSACFSENGFNETSWLKYTDMHRGFVLMYDLSNLNSFRCGKKKECINCPISKFGVSIYPVYYSNSPYDATELAKILMAEEVAKKVKVYLETVLGGNMKYSVWDAERNSLIKKECHRYDEEWRMLVNCVMNPPVIVNWIPDGIVLGLRTSTVDTKLIIFFAEQAGIKKFINYLLIKKTS